MLFESTHRELTGFCRGLVADACLGARVKNIPPFAAKSADRRASCSKKQLQGYLCENGIGKSSLR